MSRGPTSHFQVMDADKIKIIDTSHRFVHGNYEYKFGLTSTLILMTIFFSDPETNKRPADHMKYNISDLENEELWRTSHMWFCEEFRIYLIKFIKLKAFL